MIEWLTNADCKIHIPTHTERERQAQKPEHCMDIVTSHRHDELTMSGANSQMMLKALSRISLNHCSKLQIPFKRIAFSVWNMPIKSSIFSLLMASTFSFSLSFWLPHSLPFTIFFVRHFAYLLQKAYRM